MPRKSLGVIKLEWTCPNCNSRNPGPKKTCQNCGAPQPENVNFEVGASQERVTDAEEIKKAVAGADIHCPYCSARNPAGTATCSQCGGDLREGKLRQVGRILETPQAGTGGQVACTNCGTVNPGTSINCAKCGSPLRRAATPLAATPSGPAAGQSLVQSVKSNPRRLWILGGVLGLLAVCCIGIYAIFLRPAASVRGTVDSVHWQTAVQVQEQQAVHYEDRQGDPPSGAYNVSCHTESKDVCEQKTVDLGNGYAEVVEECHTETDQFCSYSALEWKTVQTATLEGDDLNPFYASPSLSSDQRIGDKTEDLTVSFDSEKGAITYSPNAITEYQQFQIGSQWLLELNAVGGILSVEPVP